MENQDNDKQLIHVPGIGEVEELAIDDILASLGKIYAILEAQEKHDHSNKKGTGVPVSFKHLEEKPVAKDFDHNELKNVENGGHVKGGDNHDHSGKGGGATIDHNNLKNKGKSSHEAIDKHLSDNKNPHGITADQIKAMPSSGGRVNSNERPVFELNREDLGTVLALLSQGKTITEISDKEVFIKVELKGKYAQFEDIKIKKINGTELEKLLKTEKPTHKGLTDAGRNDHRKIDEHLETNGNPHATTAKDVGALPLEGGKIVGGLEIQLRDGKVFAILAEDGKQLILIKDGQFIADSAKIRELSVEKLNAKIDHSQIEGKGKHSHEEIDKHLLGKNPHNLKLEDIIKDGDIKGSYIEKHSLLKSHLDPELLQELLPQVKKENLDEIKKYIEIKIEEYDESIGTDLAELENKLAKYLSRPAEPVQVIQPLAIPEQPPNPLPSGVGFRLEKQVLFVDGIKGIAFRVGNDIVAVTNDGLLINGVRWINKEERTIVQNGSFDSKSVIEEVARVINDNLKREIDALKKKNQEDLASFEKNINNASDDKIARALDSIQSPEQKVQREPTVYSSDIIGLPGARIEGNKLILEYEAIKLLATQIEFNETARIELNGDIVTEGNVCGVDLNDIQKDGTIDHAKLKNGGRVSHSELDRHVNLKTNPHETRIIQSKDGEDALNRLAALEAELAELREILKNIQK